MKVKLAAGLLVPVLFALVTGCGSGDGGSKVASVNSPSPSSSGNQPKGANLDPADEDKLREFAKCMRDNGIDMPDPDFTGTGSAKGQALDLGDDTKKFEEAAKACGMGDGGMIAVPAAPANG